uniref:Uncharacterized protein n=1 Tax=Cacopsylla melanoneura TaxID=428564 RepID=A0A8D8V6N9_9HEMI
MDLYKLCWVSSNLGIVVSSSLCSSLVINHQSPDLLLLLSCFMPHSHCYLLLMSYEFITTPYKLSMGILIRDQVLNEYPWILLDQSWNHIHSRFQRFKISLLTRTFQTYFVKITTYTM